jgi:hypothetical protein
MADELSREVGEPTSRYPMLSGLLLLSLPMSCLVSYLIAGDYTWLNAIALLIIPLAVFSWIFTTIRAIHLLGLRFWFIPSTYVTLVGSILAVLISAIMFIFTQETARRGNQTTDSTLYVTAAILYGGCVVWSYFYNWRRTGSAVLAISLTILQSIWAAFVIGAINLWLDRRNMERYNREHGLG